MASELLLATQSNNLQNVSCCFWDYTNGNIRHFYKNGGNVTSKTLSIIGNDYIVTAEEMKPLLHIWPYNQTDPLKSLRLILPEPANAVSICPTNTYIAVGLKSKLYIWELCSGKLLSIQQNHYQAITCIKFSSSGGFLIVTGQDGIIIAYNLVDLISLQGRFKVQSELGQVEPLYKRMDHSLPITDLHIGKFGFKSRFATVSLDQSLRIYQLVNGTLLLTLIFTTPLTALVVDSPFFGIYIGDNKGDIWKYDLTFPPRTLEDHVNEDPKMKFVGHKGKILCLDLNVYNNKLASSSEDNNIFIWDLTSRQILRKIELRNPARNITFVLTCSEMFGQNHKSTTLINNFERSQESNSEGSNISVINKEEVCLCDTILTHRYVEEKETIQDLQAEILTLKKLNMELFSQLQKT